MKHAPRLPLTVVAAGSNAVLTTMDETIDPIQREQLLAYGLSIPCRLRVLQQQPMTLILTDEIELALEHAVARHLWVVVEGRSGQP